MTKNLSSSKINCILTASISTPTSHEEKFKNSPLCHLVETYLRSYFQDNSIEGLKNIYSHILSQIEKPLFALVLEATHNNQSKAAEILGMSRNTLRKKLQDLSKLQEALTQNTNSKLSESNERARSQNSRQKINF